MFQTHTVLSTTRIQGRKATQTSHNATDSEEVENYLDALDPLWTERETIPYIESGEADISFNLHQFAESQYVDEFFKTVLPTTSTDSRFQEGYYGSYGDNIRVIILFSK